MQVLTDAQKRMTANGPGGFVPPRQGLGDLWLAAVDILVRVLTLGRGRVVKAGRIGPIHWGGVLK